MSSLSKNIPDGFIGLQANVGLKEAENDCLLVASTVPTKSAAVFTRSLFAGPSVVISQKSRDQGVAFQGLVVLSKNANVATGPEGHKHALELRELAARVLNIPTESVLVASTGVIGKNYPMEEIRSRFTDFDGRLEGIDYTRAAQAIMTTDSRPKSYTVSCGDSTIVGIAKGVGMIEPNMATLLAFFFTDAEIEQQKLDEIFRHVVDRTFNAMSIDTDTSTSDTAAIFANGLAGPVSHDLFRERLHECALSLVKQIVSDGEGATKTITVNVSQARDDRQARKVAKSVVNSPLVKTAVHGSDPNWGRVVMAIGKLDEETDIRPETTTVAFGDQQLFPLKDFSQLSAERERLKSYLSGSEIEINISLGIGAGEFTAYGCDLSEGYIRINADYTT